MKTINVGWFIEDTHKAKFVFNEPFPVKKNRKIPLSKRAVQACPAINHFEKRYFQVNFPYDLRLRYEFEHEKHNLYVIPENTRIDDDLIPQNVVLMPPKFWRDENFPTIQIMCPYVFVSDEEVFMSQLPPFLDYKHNLWPGVVTSGRFPINIWPRILSWGFEWVDKEKDLIFKRGDPWFYVFFESKNPNDQIKLIMADNTDDLKEYRKGIADTVKYTSNSFGLFEEAKKRRPKKLLKERKR
ncbi:hypothetical protein IDH08_05545 [Pelagibacterales bacterium SAG-MED22]|nr:hypothetical protein [Pelagibacterales bacterium SAG-MED22]